MGSTINAVSQLLDALGRVPFVIGVLTKGSLLILLAVAFTRLLTRAPAAARHLVWSLSVAGLLLLPATSWFPWQLELDFLASARDVLTTPSVTDVAPPTPDETSAPSERAEGVALAPNVASTATADAPAVMANVPATNPLDAQVALTSRLSDPALVLVLVWLAGVLWMTGRLAIGVAAVRRMVRDSVPADDSGWHEIIGDARESLGVRQDVGVVISESAAMPFTYGLLRPTIVLPDTADDWTPERRRSVLLHELAHVRRGDLLTNAVVQLACAVYWFHPLIRMAARRVRIEAERACDALVVAAGKLPSDYAGDLLDIARTMRSSSTAAVALAMARRSDFEGRLLAILAPDSGRNMLTAARATLIALAFVAPAVAVAAAVPARPATPNAPAAVQQDSTDRTSDSALDESETATDEASTESAVQERPDAATSSATQEQQTRDAAVPALLTVVRDENAAVRLAAIEALGQHADPRAIDALVEVLRTDTDARVREAAASALGSIENPRAVPGLIAALGNERTASVRAKIAWALGEIEDPRAVDGLGSALRDQNVEVRRQAVWALGNIESADAVPSLIPLLRDSDMETRKQAAWALGEIESADAVTALSAAAKDQHPDVRDQVIWALGEIGNDRALPALTAALSDDEVEVRRKAVWAIGEIEGLRSAPAGLIAALRDSDREVRMNAAQALGSLEDEAAVPGLVPLTRDTDVEVRRAAVQALSDIGGVRAIEAIVALLKDDDPEIRKIAAEALGKR